MSVAASVPTSSASCDDALALLPHAAPFRFITRLHSLERGVRATALWLVEGQEDFFRGHFPGNPIVPGVLIGEALAQISGIVCGSAGQRFGPIQGRLAHIDLRFPKMVTPPAEIVLASELSRSLDRLHLFAVVATVNDDAVARGNLTLAIE